jgi:lipid-A-disaccharide synthase
MILRAFASFLEILRKDRPDLIVLIDYPGLHLVMAEAARRHGVPVVHYVAPQYWAWGPWRMKRYRRAMDGTLTILPFEPAFFRGEGLASEYVGHPLLDEVAGSPPDAAAVARVRDRPTLVLMPGSRRREIEDHLGPMVRLARRLAADRPDLRIVIPHRDERRAELIRVMLAAMPGEPVVEAVAGDPGPWLAGARAALVKSGTGSLEACLHGTPTTIVYVVRGVVSRWVYHHLLTVPFFASANLCMNRRIVPELAVERSAQWDDVRRHVAELLDDSPVRRQCLRDLEALHERLGAPGASARAARWILPFCPAEPPR